jgi:hypothetical protein
METPTIGLQSIELEENYDDDEAEVSVNFDPNVEA